MTLQLTTTKQEGETLTQAKARASVTPENLSAIVLTSCAFTDETHINELAKELKHQTKAINAGDMTRAENMLASQAHTLEALFSNLASRAMNTKNLVQLDTLLRLALKAQGQCRATLQTLGELKAPKQIAFVKQANIGNQVQVNNGVAPQPLRTRKTKNKQTELLEVEHGQRLDTRAPGKASGNDSTLEAVGEKHRATQRRR
jgi:hypothetical protein